MSDPNPLDDLPSGVMVVERYEDIPDPIPEGIKVILIRTGTPPQTPSQIGFKLPTAESFTYESRRRSFDEEVAVALRGKRSTGGGGDPFDGSGRKSWGPPPKLLHKGKRSYRR